MSVKVLIAHGDTQQLEKAVRDFIAAGFEVVATPDGGDAFARFFEEDPDLVVCSDVLPVLDGRSFGRMIRSQSPDVPVVLLVVDANRETDDEFLVLQEPLDLAALSQLVPNVVSSTDVSTALASQPQPQAESPTAGGAAGSTIESASVPMPRPQPIVQPVAVVQSAPTKQPSESAPIEQSSALADTDAQAAQDEAASLLSILVSFQRQGNLLALLDAAGLQRFARIAVLQNRPQEDLVIREGDPCDGFYLVVEGEVRVTLAERGGEEVARLGSGEFFGEMALLSDQPRSATVWTVGPSHLVFFERDAVLEFLKDYPQLRNLLGGVALQRAEDNLFEALADDDDVQSSLSGLLDGVDEPQPPVSYPEPDDEVGTEEQSGEEHSGTALLPPPPAAAAQQSAMVWEDEPGDGARPTAPHNSPGTAVERLQRRLRLWGQELRLYTLQHPLGVGLAGGLVGGVLLMVLLLSIYFQWSGPESGEDLGAHVVVTDEHTPDAGTPDAGTPVVGTPDAGTPDAGTPDEGTPDEGQPDAGTPVAGTPVEGTPDAGTPDEGQSDQGNSDAGESDEAEKMSRISSMVEELAKASSENRLEQVIELGKQLQALEGLDANSQYLVAEAARASGLNELAFEHYQSFARNNPQDSRADNALYWAAKSLAGQRRLREARDLFQKVADDPKSDMRTKAEQRVKELQ